MKKIVLLITIQILCMHSFVVNAQRIFSTSYTMDDGLAANRVYSILQDSCGFMWFGTDDGLSRFDGIAFKPFGGTLRHPVDRFQFDASYKIGQWSNRAGGGCP